MIIGADEMDRKGLLAVADGYRESAQLWRNALLDFKHPGLEVALKLATGASGSTAVAAYLGDSGTIDFH